MQMVKQCKCLLDTAYNEINYLEKNSDAFLNDKYANVGERNYTKYARDCFPELQGMAWCCMFVWWCFEKAFGKIMARNLIGEKTAKCSTMKDRMIGNSCQEILPIFTNPGDIVFFNNGIGINHIGIVYSVGSNSFSTIEGNTTRGYDQVVANGGGVFLRAYNYQNDKIDCILRPRWDLFKECNEQQKCNAQIIATNVNIRAGAGVKNNKLGMETKGFRFNIIGKEQDENGKIWYKFIYKGKTAYIISDFVNKR